jgi:hypothetical protein
MNVLKPETWSDGGLFATGAIMAGPVSFWLASMLGGALVVRIAAGCAGMILGGVVGVLLRDELFDLWRAWW